MLREQCPYRLLARRFGRLRLIPPGIGRRLDSLSGQRNARRCSPPARAPAVGSARRALASPVHQRPAGRRGSPVASPRPCGTLRSIPSPAPVDGRARISAGRRDVVGLPWPPDSPSQPSHPSDHRAGEYESGDPGKRPCGSRTSAPLSRGGRRPSLATLPASSDRLFLNERATPEDGSLEFLGFGTAKDDLPRMVAIAFADYPNRQHSAALQQLFRFGDGKLHVVEHGIEDPPLLDATLEFVPNVGGDGLRHVS